LGLVIVYLILAGHLLWAAAESGGQKPALGVYAGHPTARYMMLAFVLCGFFAGMAGALQVTGVYHRLIPSISSGYGFMGLLVAMLVNYQPIWAGWWPLALPR
jgi:general nucleoside transport system permease protein